MIVIVDRANGKLVQKVTNPKTMAVRYQVVAESSVGDAGSVRVCPTLVAARAAIGKTNAGKLTAASA